MGQVLVTESNLQNIANAIREKNGSSDTYTPAEMSSAISNIPTGLYDWIGNDIEKVSDLYDNTYSLSSSAYSTWSASTTAKSLRATQSLSTVTLDMVNYAYLLRWQVFVTVGLKTGATLNAIPVKQLNMFDQFICRRPSNLTNIQSNTYNGNIYLNSTAMAWMEYYNTSSTLTCAYSSSYGFYGSVPTPTFSSSTANAPKLTPKTPVLYVRCSDTYFATARYGDIDTETTSYHTIGTLYRVDKTKNEMYQKQKELVDIVRVFLT